MLKYQPISDSSPSSSRSRKHKALQWDPESLLRVRNVEKNGSISCVGEARTYKRRCRIGLSQANVSKAFNLLDRIKAKGPESRDLSDNLDRLAELLLCPAFHRSQTFEVTGKWKQDILRETIRLRAEQSVKQSKRTTIRVPSSWKMDKEAASPLSADESEMEIEEVASSSLSTSYEDEDDELDDDENEDDDDEDEDDSVSSQSIDAASGTVNRITEKMASVSIANPMTPDSKKRVLQPLLDIENPFSESPFPTPEKEAVNNQPTPNTAVCKGVHVQRRALSEDCSICKESCSQSPLNSLLWCKSTCGHNVHSHCFNEWAGVLRKLSATVRCTHCHTAWGETCSHDDDEPSVTVQNIWTSESDDRELLFIIVFIYLILSDLGRWLWTILAST